TAEDPDRNRSVLKAMFAKLKESPGFLWFFDNTCQLRTSYSSTGEFPALPNLCEEAGTLLKSSEDSQQAFLLAHHILQDRKGLPYGQLLIAKKLDLQEWEQPSQVLHVSADLVSLTMEPLTANALDGFRIHSLPVPTTRDFYLNLFYDNKRLEATAINTTVVAMLVFLMMGLILYLGVRLVLEKTITGPTNQLLGDVRAFVENDHQVPLRKQQSQELDQLYQAIHEMTVAIQESRKRQLDQLEERLQMRSKLEIADALGHISHEINRYLGAIRISAEFLRLLPDQDPKPQLLQIEASVDKCAATLREVMQACRSGQLGSFNLKKLLKEQLPLYQSQEQIPLRLDYFTNVEEVYFSRSLISSFLENCIQNAADSIRQAQPASPSIRIEVGEYFQQDRPFLRVSVYDNGTGIPVDTMDQLGKQSVTSLKASGNGFGLYSLSNLLERHGAVLHFTNLQEGGAMIRLVFPLDLTPIDPNLRN
ncbi:MAG: HAMP domain-containing sensor histidine kinase, partial [Proteobacteria bacterium]|nr:HAMP domain-containing sensor histidine kinase [Pseudomonadota bacterium]